MPSLHCHLPPDEEEKIPEQEIMDLGVEVVTLNTRIIRSDEEVDDTSGEASSIFNDPMIQQLVPEINSGDDNDNESDGGFLTPPSSISDEFQQLEVSAAEIRTFLLPERNTARRGRGGQGVFYVRRGRNNGPLRRNDLNGFPTSDDIQSFNGFAQGLEPEVVTGHAVYNPRGLMYSVKWKNLNGTRLVESSVMRANRPEMIVEYYESAAAKYDFF